MGRRRRGLQRDDRQHCAHDPALDAWQKLASNLFHKLAVVKNPNEAQTEDQLIYPLLESLGYDPVPAYQEPAWSPEATPELFEQYPLVLTTGNSLKWYYRSQH